MSFFYILIYGNIEVENKYHFGTSNKFLLFDLTLILKYPAKPKEEITEQTVTQKPADIHKCVLLTFKKAQIVFPEYFNSNAAFIKCQEV